MYKTLRELLLTVRLTAIYEVKESRLLLRRIYTLCWRRHLQPAMACTFSDWEEDEDIPFLSFPLLLLGCRRSYISREYPLLSLSHHGSEH